MGAWTELIKKEQRARELWFLRYGPIFGVRKRNVVAPAYGPYNGSQYMQNNLPPEMPTGPDLQAPPRYTQERSVDGHEMPYYAHPPRYDSTNHQYRDPNPRSIRQEDPSPYSHRAHENHPASQSHHQPRNSTPQRPASADARSVASHRSYGSRRSGPSKRSHSRQENGQYGHSRGEQEERRPPVVGRDAWN
eukprot:CAMPEP_0196661564 /NCGR_PEP_ID=MMETSP1086-20130531/44882_1 /TAXON_ID=77921 /ORGANISM="Cyanoptyche  gloeocystis , Strain SAG4.97" /LENGTH=190 /DNA_ID=CAMNT_0041996521 /DNA_START=84 /DNA_END=656 /DNA_ORIENTATION=-